MRIVGSKSLMLVTLAFASLSTGGSWAGENAGNLVFTNVVGPRLDSAQADNKSFFAEVEYFSKRYRVVTVNPSSVFTNPGETFVELFPDVRIHGINGRLEKSEGNLTFRWRGEYADAPLRKDAFIARQLGRGSDASHAEALYSALYEFEITGAGYARGTDNVARYVGEVRMNPDTQTYNLKDLDSSAQRESIEFYEITAEIQPPVDEGTYNSDGIPADGIYMIYSVPGDRELHVIYEVDPGKMFPPGEFDAAAHPELAERRRAYEEHMRAFESTIVPKN